MIHFNSTHKWMTMMGDSFPYEGRGPGSFYFTGRRVTTTVQCIMEIHYGTYLHAVYIYM